MSTAPLVTAVIPVYNCARFVREAITSVLNQTYQRLEAVIVDDGSTDATPEVLDEFDDVVRRIRTPNRGVSSARNTGIAAARGEYIAFLDADDVWLPEKVSQQMDLLRRRPEVALAYSGMHLIDEDSHFRGRVEAPPPEAALRNTLLLERPFMSVAQTGIVRKDVTEALGGFDERLSTSADCHFACRVAARHPVDAVPHPLTLYRVHPRQMHSDAVATEHEMRVIFEELFNCADLPPTLGRRRNRAYANLHVSLAGAYLQKKNRRQFVTHASRALLRRPDRVLDGVRRLTRPAGGISRAP